MLALPLFVSSSASSQTTTTINFDDVAKWTQGTLGFGSYSNHSYSDQSWAFTSALSIRNGTAAQDGVAGALGTYSWRLQNSISPQFIATYGAGMTVSGFGLDVRRWDASPDSSFVVEYSTNAGASFTSIGVTINNAYLANSSNWKTLTFSLPSPVTVAANAFVVKVYATAAGERLMIDNFQWTTGVAGPDSTPPAITAQSPTPGATGVSVDTELSITFDEPVNLGTGNFQLFEEAGTTDVSIPISAVSIDGAVASFFPESALENSKTYYVLIDNGAITDEVTPTPNAFPGISSQTAWSFTTIAPDTLGPVITAVTPLNGATGVALDVRPLVTFNETLTALTGDVLIKKASNGDLVDSLDVANTAEVVVFGNQMQLKPTVTLPLGTPLYIEIPAGIVEDALGNDNLVAAGNGVWNFTTRVVPTLTESGPYLQEFTGFSAAAPTLPSGWSLTGPSTTFQSDPLQQVWGEGFNSGLRGGADLLGFQHTSSTGVLVKTLTMVNATSAPLTAITVSYTGRTARTDLTRYPAYVVQIQGNTVGSLSYSTGTGDNVSLVGSLSGLSIPVGGLFTITWTSDRQDPGSGASRQIGLDNVTVTAGIVTSAPTVAAVSVDYPGLGVTTASVASEVTSDGGDALDERGFVIAPTLLNATPIIGGPSVIKEVVLPAEVATMNKALTGLTGATSYTIRSYAINSVGTTYSVPATFITLGQAPSLVTEYTQPFTSFVGSIVAGGLPDGWKMVSSGGLNNYAGAWGIGTSSGGLVGGVAGPPGVLGYQHVGSSGVVTTSLTLKNDTGGPLDQLYVSYLGRVERPSEGRSPAWTVTVAGTTVTELGYSTASGLDEVKSHLVTGLSIAAGAEFTITWVSDGNVGTTGSRRQIGIADVLVGLTAPVGGYAGWIAGFFGVETDPLIIGFTADPDKDGIANGIEALIGGDPSVAGVFSTTELVKAGNTFSFLYPQNRDLPTGVSAAYEWSTDMVTWNGSGATQGGVTVSLADGEWTNTGSGPITYQVVATVTAGTPAKLFVRVLSVNE